MESSVDEAPMMVKKWKKSWNENRRRENRRISDFVGNQNQNYNFVGLLNIYGFGKTFITSGPTNVSSQGLYFRYTRHRLKTIIDFP